MYVSLNKQLDVVVLSCDWGSVYFHNGHPITIYLPSKAACYAPNPNGMSAGSGSRTALETMVKEFYYSTFILLTVNHFERLVADVERRFPRRGCQVDAMLERLGIDCSVHTTRDAPDIIDTDGVDPDAEGVARRAPVDEADAFMHLIDFNDTYHE